MKGAVSMFTIETPRLVLRDLQESDLQPFFALASDPAVTYFQTYIRMESEAQAKEWLKGAAFHNQKIPREAYNLAIVRKEDSRWLGWIGMGNSDDQSVGDINFGYGLSPQYWNQGYMTEALQGLVDFSFRELGIQSIFGECERENPASARVMEKAGLTCTAAFEEVDDRTGKQKTMLRYAITKPEWEALRKNTALPQQQGSANLY